MLGRAIERPTPYESGELERAGHVFSLNGLAPRKALGWLMLLGLCVWAIALAVLQARPAATADEALGLYARERQEQPFRWTSSLAAFPIRAGSGPTLVTLKLIGARWPERRPSQVALATDAGLLAAFVAPDQARTYRLLLPPSVDTLRLRASVAQPRGDPRWLGVQLLDLRARATGLPGRSAVLALLIALGSIVAALAAAWSIRRGYGAIAALAALGLLLRVVLLTRVPSGFFQDEAVSLVDAWHLAHTGRDHLGHFLPIGALEAFGDWISPLFTYLAVPVVALFGPTLLAGRLLAAVLGALAIPAGYALARAFRLPAAAAIGAALVVALSPWQILRTRVATPPALVPLCWTLCLWAALLFVRRGGRREAAWLALAAGVSVYSYPTMKLAVPLLAALASALALARHGRAAMRSWLRPALLLALLWLPLAAVTLLNADSAMRAQSKLLRADTAAEWLAQWATAYGGYFLPAFYYQTGDPSNGMPGQGVQLAVEAPLVLLGLGALLWRCLIADCRLQIADWRGIELHTKSKRQPNSKMEWWLLAGALLIAPLPASLMFPNPHLTRALIAAPGYALLAGIGLALVVRDQRRKTNDEGASVVHASSFALSLGRNVRRVVVALVLVALLWQGGQRFGGYLQQFPAVISAKYQDGMFETMQAAVRIAPQYDEVWIDDRMPFPYIFVLAAQPMPPAQAQAQIQVMHGHTTFNTVTAIGPYRFVNLAALPNDLPVVEALPSNIGGPGFVIQEWHTDQGRVLVVRRMRAA